MRGIVVLSVPRREYIEIMTDPLHIQLTARPTVDDWQPDCVMDGYQQATIHLGHDDEGDIVATFVRRDPSKLPMRARWRRQRSALRGHRLAVMYVHGWNDYFYRRHESEFWESLGIPFYAVDLRKFGRSLRDGQTLDISRICTIMRRNSTPYATWSSPSRASRCASCWSPIRRAG